MKKHKEHINSEHWNHKHDFPIEEVWNTNNTLARLIAPRLTTYKELDKHGSPPDVGDITKWNHIIQKMIDAFELMKEVPRLSDKEEVIVSEGLDMFCKYYRYLWD